MAVACFSGTLQKVTCPVYTRTVAYTGQVSLCKVPCLTGPPVVERGPVHEGAAPGLHHQDAVHQEQRTNNRCISY